jgi:hypothetical protein
MIDASIRAVTAMVELQCNLELCRVRWTQCRHHRELRIVLSLVSLRDHAADDRQAE